MKPSLPIASVARVRKLAIAGLDMRDWYAKAYGEITRVCVTEGWNPIEFSRRLALLSPRMSVRRNVRAALTYQHSGLFMVGIVASLKRSMEVFETHGTIGGQKVSAFANAILGDESAIVLDTWMAKALLVDEFLPDSKLLRRKATRTESFAVITKVGKQLGLPPRDCQACVWSGVVREHGVAAIHFPIAEEYERWLAYDREFPLSGYIPDSPEENEI